MSIQFNTNKVTWQVDTSQLGSVISSGSTPDFLTGRPIGVPVGTDTVFNVAVFTSVANAALCDLSDVAVLQLDIRNQSFTPGGITAAGAEPTGASVWTAQATSGEINTGLTVAEWNAGTAQNVQFSLPNAQTAFLLGLAVDSIYTLILSGATTTGTLVVYGSATISFWPTGINQDLANVAPVLIETTIGGQLYLSMFINIAGAKIYYTTDSSTPTNASTLYTGPILVTSTTTFKAIGYVSPTYSLVSTLVITAATVYWGCSSNTTLNAGQIAALSNSAAQAGFAGSFPCVPSGDQYLYFWFPTSLGYPSAIPAGFTLSGYELPMAGNAQGYTSMANGWSYLPVTVSGVPGSLYRSFNLISTAVSPVVS